MTDPALTLRDVTLADKFYLSNGRVYLTGTQALVRMCLMQAARLRAAFWRWWGTITPAKARPPATKANMRWSTR